MTSRYGLSVHRLDKRFGARAVLRGVSLDVEPGEVVGVFGPSGAGKTTLFRCIAHLIAADAGEIIAAGHPMHALRAE